MKRVVICGCRDFNDYEIAKEFINECLNKEKLVDEIIILSGGASGADAMGERYAIENGLEIEHYPAEWKAYGKKAGPMRNKKMAEDCDLVICFWDGQSRGTKSMISCTAKLRKTVYVKMI